MRKARVALARRLAIIMHASGRNGVHLGVGLPTTETETASSSCKERRAEGGSRRRRGFVASGITGRLRFNSSRPVPAYPIKRQRARRERRHPKAPWPAMGGL